MSKSIKYRPSLSRLLGDLIWKYKGTYLLAFVSLVVTHKAQAVLPSLAKKLGDILILGQEEIPVSQFIIIALTIVIFRSFSRILFFYPARVFQRDLRIDLMDRIQNSNPWRYQEKSVGQRFQLIFEDLNRLRTLTGFSFLQIGNTVIGLGVLVPALAEVNSKFILPLLPIGISVFAFMLLAYRYGKIFRENSFLQGETRNFIIESYNGKQTIQNYGKESDFIQRFSNISDLELKTFLKASYGSIFGAPLLSLGLGASLIWGALVVQSEGLSGTYFILYSGFVFLIRGPLAFVAWLGTITYQSLMSWRRIEEFVTELDNPSEREVHIQDNLNENFYSVELWGEKQKLSRFEHNWNVFCGETGHGKSYILEQIAFDLKARGLSFAMVCQEPHLYNTSFKENVYLGLDFENKKKELRELIEVFELGSLEQDFESILKMQVGEFGKKLSGGQVKKVNLIRSLLFGTDYLIWDDPFSSIDILGEEKVIRFLKRHEKYKNVVFILSSHRLTTVREANDVFFIDKLSKKITKENFTEIQEQRGRLYEFFAPQLEIS